MVPEDRWRGGPPRITPALSTNDVELELRVVLDQAIERRKLYGTRTILFVDEVHRWNRAQQDALLPHVENGVVILIGATTENPYFEVNKALVSRSRIFQLRPVSYTHLTLPTILLV